MGSEHFVVPSEFAAAYDDTPYDEVEPESDARPTPVRSSRKKLPGCSEALSQELHTSDPYKEQT